MTRLCVSSDRPFVAEVGSLETQCFQCWSLEQDSAFGKPEPVSWKALLGVGILITWVLWACGLFGHHS